MIIWVKVVLNRNVVVDTFTWTSCFTYLSNVINEQKSKENESGAQSNLIHNTFILTFPTDICGKCHVAFSKLLVMVQVSKEQIGVRKIPDLTSSIHRLRYI